MVTMRYARIFRSLIRKRRSLRNRRVSSRYPRRALRASAPRRRAGSRSRRRGGRSGRAFVRPFSLTSPAVPKSIIRRIHIPSGVRVSSFARKVARHTGHYHFLSWQGTQNSASGATRLYPMLRFHAGLGGLMFLNWGFVQRDMSLSANDYAANYPQYSRYLLAYIMIKLTVKQIQESGRVRVSLVRTTRMSGEPSNTLPLANFTRDLNTFQTTQYYNILWQKYLDFTVQPTNDVNSRIATVNLYLPFWRMMETTKRAAANAETDWEPPGSRWFDFTYFVIDSDDDLASTTKYFSYDCRVRAKFFELE